MRAKDREQAFHLFCDGKTLAEIAEQIGVHRSTVERWSSQHQWRHHRQKTWDSAIEAAGKERASLLTKLDKEVSGHLFEYLNFAHSEMIAYMKGQIPKTALKFSRKDLCQIAIAFMKAEEIEVRLRMKDTLPSID